MIPAELLRKKRDGAALDDSEITFLVQGLLRGDVSPAQASAFLMAACIRGLTARETAALTLAMAHSGTVFDWSDINAPVVDKHSTGGVGDTISLLLAPLAAECGLAVPMISGRSLGHTGGTVDKLESIVGMTLDPANHGELLRRNGVFMARQTAALAPADGLLYALRDETGTVESVGLLTASILSKKIAEGLDALVMDVKVGRGAFLPAFESARELACALRDGGREAGLPVRVVFTAMDQPLGRAAGNWVEVEEAIDALGGTVHDDVREVTEALCTAMLLAAGTTADRGTALGQVREAWSSGRALGRFVRMVEAQGGDLDASRKRYADVPRIAITARADGVIAAMHARKIGVAGITLGVGRMHRTDEVDPAAGFVFLKKTGEVVRRGEEIGWIQGRRTAVFADVRAAVEAAVDIGPEPPPSVPVVLGELE